VGWIDRLRAWLRGGDPPTARATRSGRRTAPSRAAAAGRSGTGRRGGRSEDAGDPVLVEFAASRAGVEAYLEPRTAVHPQSVLLVAADGEILRRPIADAQRVRRFCAQRGIPVYDASRVGYPRRIRDFDRGVRQEPVRLSDLPPWPGDAPGGVTGGDGVDGDGADDDGPPEPPADA
jgi:hypothetical protein